jgi:Zn-dependent peptidase ImmA (M78 family)
MEGLNLPQARLGKISLSQNPLDVSVHARKTLGVTTDDQLHWDNANTALRAWREALGHQGILVLQLTFPIDDARGLSLPSPIVPTLVVNSADIPQARIFTMFHEFSHLLLRAAGLCSPEADGEQQLPHALAQVERFCNEFAGELLVPRLSLFEVLERRRGPLGDEQVETMARQWKVSRQVIWRRLFAASVISKQQYWNKLRIWQHHKPKTKRSGGFFAVPAPVRVLREKGRFFTNLVVAAHQRELITTNEMADYLGTKVRHLSKVSQMLETSTGS